MFGERLAELRKDKGLDQKDLGAVLGLSYHTISSYERGKSEPNLPMLKQIAEFFDISVDYLLGLTRERVSYRHDENVIVLPKELSADQRKQVNDFISFILKD